MNFSTYRFTLSLHLTQSQVSLPVTLGDNARVFLITLSDGGAPYVIGDGCLAKIEIKRPTGTILQEFCPIEKNSTIVYDFSQNEGTAVVPGVHNCTITLYNAKGLILGSPRFTMVVSDRVVTSDDMPLDDVDFTIRDAMLAKESERQEAENTRVNAENARVNAEKLRCSSEESREAAEALRHSNERERKEAYDNRNAELESVKNALSNKIDKVQAQEGKQYTVAAVDKDGNPTSLAVDVGGHGWAIPLRETGGRLRVPAPTIDGHAINRGYLNEQISPLEERISALEGSSNKEEFLPVESDEDGIIPVPGGARQYAQISELRGAQASYYEAMDGSCLPNYPTSVYTGDGRTLFEMPSDAESRLNSLGIEGNYIFFEDGKAFYKQTTRVVHWYETLTLYEGEAVLNSWGSGCCTYIVKLALPVVTDITDYLNANGGVIDIGEKQQIFVNYKWSEQAFNEMIESDDESDDMYHLSNGTGFSTPVAKIIFEV